MGINVARVGAGDIILDLANLHTNYSSYSDANDGKLLIAMPLDVKCICMCIYETHRRLHPMLRAGIHSLSLNPCRLIRTSPYCYTPRPLCILCGGGGPRRTRRRMVCNKRHSHLATVPMNILSLNGYQITTTNTLHSSSSRA